jgi:hypothetical protein
VRILTVTLRGLAAPEQVEPDGLGSPLCGGMIVGAVRKVGVAIYPGQSAVDVLMIAAVIERELDAVDHYHARDVARQILLAQGIGHKA